MTIGRVGCAALLFTAACGGDTTSLRWEYSFEDPTVEAAAVILDASIIDGGCDPGATPIYRVEVPLSSAAGAMAPPSLSPGFYGFRLSARNDVCEEIASGCVGVDVNTGTTRVLVVLGSATGAAACPPDECMGGSCAGGVDAGGIDAGPGACPPDLGDCNGDEADGCETPLTVDGDCGACGVTCAFANATAACTAGACTLDTCTMGFGDCNGMEADGCESPLNTAVNCETCGAPCSLANATSSCATGTCEVAMCEVGFDDCDSNAGNGCETGLDQLAHCGGCGVSCDRANATPSCALGACAIATCDADFDDCDMADANGCETDLTTTVDCGTCGNACAATDTCMAGVCCASGCPCVQTCRSGSPCACSGGCQCSLDARSSDAAATCTGAGTLCQIDAASTNDLGTIDCNGGARCILDASRSSNAVNIRCSGVGTVCDIDCTGVSNCTVRCTGGAMCVVDCSMSGNCPGSGGSWGACTGTRMNCPGRGRTCNFAACP